MSLARDVARRAGVSTATVSRVLNGSTHVSPELRARVEEAARELGYEANALARSLRQRRTRLLGLVVTDLTDHSFALAARAIEDYVHQAGYHLMLCITGDDAAREQRHLTVLRRLRVDGLIITPCGDNEDQVLELAARGTPVVLVARRSRYTKAPLDTVIADVAGGVQNAVEHLIKLGHRRIAILPGPLYLSTARDQMAGYWRAITRHGLAYDDSLVEECALSTGAAGARVRRLLQLADPPSAFLVGSNLMVPGTLRAIRECGLHIPDDVALVGLGDSPWTCVGDPSLTVVALPAREMGWAAARLLLERIGARDPLPPREVVLPTHLIVRRSCGSRFAVCEGSGGRADDWPLVVGN